MNIHLRRVKRVADRAPETAVQSFVEMWARASGMPMAIAVDEDKEGVELLAAWNIDMEELRATLHTRRMAWSL